MPGKYNKNKNANLNKKVNTAFKLARNNRKIMMGETKVFDDIITADTIDILGIVKNLCDIDQGLLGVGFGSTNALRIGNEIYARSMTLRFRIQWVDTGLENAIRLLLVQKLSNDVAPPTILSADNTDVVEDIAGAIDVLAHPKWINRKRYKILMDETLIGDPQRQENIVFKRFFRFKHKIYYGGATGPQPKGGSLFFLAYGSSDTGPPVIDLQSRLTFKDM